jgi:hypothetical protein
MKKCLFQGTFFVASGVVCLMLRYGGRAMKAVRWQPADGDGLEHLEVDMRSDGITAESVLAGEGFGAAYRIECDPAWNVTRVVVTRMGGATLELISDAEGRWTDGNGSPRDDLAGCIDIDISATPFTNTLPIRRLKLAVGERRVIRVVYIALPELTAARVEQAYTCIEQDRRYRYEGITSRYTAELPVGADGFVIDYPGLFRRRYT